MVNALLRTLRHACPDGTGRETSPTTIAAYVETIGLYKPGRSAPFSHPSNLWELALLQVQQKPP